MAQKHFYNKKTKKKKKKKKKRERERERERSPVFDDYVHMQLEVGRNLLARVWSN
jgi:poly-D-alanine transfer protein DltD